MKSPALGRASVICLSVLHSLYHPQKGCRWYLADLEPQGLWNRRRSRFFQLILNRSCRFQTWT